MTTPVFQPVVVLEEYGELAKLPANGVISAGGTAGPNFSVGGKALIFSDGTATDGSGQVITVGTNSVTGFEHIQSTASTTWVVAHNKNTKRIQITIWDSMDETLLPDSVQSIDANTVQILFNTAITGRADLILF